MTVPRFQCVYLKKKKRFWCLGLPKQEQAALVSLRTPPQGWVFCPVQGELGLLASSSFIYVFDYLFIKIIVPGSQSQKREVFEEWVVSCIMCLGTCKYLLYSGFVLKFWFVKLETSVSYQAKEWEHPCHLCNLNC